LRIVELKYQAYGMHGRNGMYISGWEKWNNRPNERVRLRRI